VTSSAAASSSGAAGRQPPGKHRLAGAGRAVQREVVTAGGGQLHGPSAALLARDVGEVGAGRRRRPGRSADRAAAPRPGELQYPAQRVRGPHGDAGQQRGLRGVRHRHHDPGQAGALGGEPGPAARPGPGGRRRRAQLAEDDAVGERRRGQHPGGRENAHRDREIEAGARLRQVGREQVDGDALLRPPLAGVDHGGADAVAGLGHRGVGESGDDQVRQARGHVRLHRDHLPHHADQGHRPDPRVPHLSRARSSMWMSCREPWPPRPPAATAHGRHVDGGPGCGRGHPDADGVLWEPAGLRRPRRSCQDLRHVDRPPYPAGRRARRHRGPRRLRGPAAPRGLGCRAAVGGPAGVARGRGAAVRPGRCRPRRPPRPARRTPRA
jgi:hypothetical protein